MPYTTFSLKVILLTTFFLQNTHSEYFITLIWMKGPHVTEYVIIHFLGKLHIFKCHLALVCHILLYNFSILLQKRTKRSSSSIVFCHLVTTIKHQPLCTQEERKLQIIHLPFSATRIANFPFAVFKKLRKNLVLWAGSSKY